MQYTSLYIPLTDFTINDKDGFRILYENLIQSGPAYRLVVPDSPSWHQIRDQIENPEQITILSEKEANYYKELSKDFFAPITQAAPYYEDHQGKKSMDNLTADLRRALSYILIANDYEARIFEDDILDYYNPLESLEKNGFSEDCLSRVLDLLTVYLRVIRKITYQQFQLTKIWRILRQLRKSLLKQK